MPGSGKRRPDPPTDLTPNPPRPIPAEGSERSSKLAHRVAGVLRRRIVRTEMAPDERLPSEAELMAAFEVSRETVREALGILASESLIRVRRGPGGGAVAQRPRLNAAARYLSLLLQARGVCNAEVREAKELLERDAAGLVAAEPPDGAVPALRARQQAEVSDAADPLRFVAAVAAFDADVMGMCGNTTLAILAGALREASAGALHAGLMAAPADGTLPERVGGSHGRFIAAVVAQDGPAGARAWSDYVTESGTLHSSDNGSLPLDVVPLWRTPPTQWVSTAGSQRRTSSVALELRARLATGELRPGDRLPSLPDLAAQFEVSRPTMREALRVLESEGLLVISPGSRLGPEVQLPSVRHATRLVAVLLESAGTTMGDVSEARQLIEPAMMALAAQRINAAGLQTLRAAYERSRAAVDDTPAFFGQHLAFRLAALEPTGNGALVVILEIIRWLATGSLAAITTSTAALPWEVRANRRIAATYGELVEAYEGADGERAARLWRDHLAVTVPLFRGSLADRLVTDLAD
jgi:DNA-binding FadR family transcriptional regulator